MRKLVLFLGLILVLILGVMAYNAATNPEGTSLLSLTPTPAPWQPAQLRVSALNIDAPVINVGSTASGAMDAPTSKAVHSPYWTSVFWYDEGAAPGQAGNAVIAGHVDRVGGDPAIFWSLSSLKPGDTVRGQSRRQLCRQRTQPGCHRRRLWPLQRSPPQPDYL